MKKTIVIALSIVVVIGVVAGAFAFGKSISNDNEKVSTTVEQQKQVNKDEKYDVNTNKNLDESVEEISEVIENDKNLVENGIAEDEIVEEEIVEEETQSTKKPETTKKEETTKKPETTKKEETTKKPETTKKEETTKAPTESNPTSIFNNVNNNQIDYGQVTIKPYKAYWENGQFVTECYIINGTDKTVGNINVKSLAFLNKSGEIASGSFGSLGGTTISPYCHVKWKFTFGADCVKAYGADISTLGCSSLVSYSS